MTSTSPVVPILVYFGVGLIVAFLWPLWYGKNLTRKGYTFLGSVEAESPKEAMIRMRWNEPML